MRDEDLPAVDDLRQRNRLVGPPFLDSLTRFYEDDEVVRLALKVDLGLLGVSSDHDGFSEGRCVVLGSRIVDLGVYRARLIV